MAIAVGTPLTAGASSTSATTASLSSASGSYLFALGLGRGATAGIPTITDSLGQTWTALTGAAIDAGNVVGDLYYIVSDGQARTVTATSASAGQTGVLVVEVSGIGGDFSNFVTDTDTAGDPSLTMGAFAANSGCLYFGIGNAGAAWSTPTGYTEVTDGTIATNLRCIFGYNLSSPGTAIAATSNATDSILYGLEVKEPVAATSLIFNPAPMAPYLAM